MSYFIKEQALAIGRKYHLEDEVRDAIENHGESPDEALLEWDILPIDEMK